MPPYGGVPHRNLFASDGRSGETYLDLMKNKLPEDVLVFWTGDGGVFSPTVTLSAAQTYATLVGHKIALWDNNALLFVRERRPLSGRAPDLPALIATYMGNMADDAAWVGTDGQFALLTALLYAWDPEAYDPTAAGALANRLLQ